PSSLSRIHFPLLFTLFTPPFHSSLILLCRSHPPQTLSFFVSPPHPPLLLTTPTARCHFSLSLLSLPLSTLPASSISSHTHSYTCPYTHPHSYTSADRTPLPPPLFCIHLHLHQLHRLLLSLTHSLTHSLSVGVFTHQQPTPFDCNSIHPLHRFSITPNTPSYFFPVSSLFTWSELAPISPA
ncbi:MAG: hypothetical protein JOS17DRAFT_723204, partial [Linnemannia elongata]